MKDLIKALERREIEPLETGKNYIGFESDDDASEAFVFLKRDFPSLDFRLKADRVEVKGMPGKKASSRSASEVIRELENRIARLERQAAKASIKDVEKVFEDLVDNLVSIAKAQKEAEEDAVKSGAMEDGDQVMSETYNGRLIGHVLDALNKLEGEFKGTIQESRDNIANAKG